MRFVQSNIQSDKNITGNAFEISPVINPMYIELALQTSLAKIEFSSDPLLNIRNQRKLRYHQVITVQDLIQHSAGDLVAIYGLDVFFVSKVRDFLKANGLSLNAVNCDVAKQCVDKYADTILNTPLRYVKFSENKTQHKSILYALEKRGVLCVGDLVTKSNEELLLIKHISKHRLQAILAFVETYKNNMKKEKD